MTVTIDPVGEPQGEPSTTGRAHFRTNRARKAIGLTQWFGPTLTVVLYFACLVFLGFSGLRLVLTFMLESVDWAQAAPDLLAALFVGGVADAAVAALMGLVLLIALKSLRPLSRYIRSPLLFFGVFGCFAALFGFGLVAEIFFWNEFAGRFSGIAVSYLIFPREVIGNIEESFQASNWLPAFVAFGAIATVPARTWLREAVWQRPQTSRSTRLIVVLLIANFALGVLYFLPERRADNREIDELAHNGVETFVRAALTNDAAYAGFYPTINSARAQSIVKKLVMQPNTTLVEPNNGTTTLRQVAGAAAAKTPNIILVTEETFGSVFVDSLDNTLGVSISPDLDQLAKEGLFFTNIYASGDRTVRGLEATETAFAPIPGISTARRPGSKGMYSLPQLLNSFGYDTGVLYGGMSAFDNMGTFWNGIGFDHVWDQADVRHDSFTTIWGVSDEDLFTEALQRMDEQTAKKKPVLLTMMTVSNHRPYKFPQNNVKWDDGMGRIQNTARYAQWAFVDFVKRAQKKPWFDNTIFVFVGDHGVKVNGAARVPVHAFRVPVLIYGPKFISPGRVDTLGAQIDLIPTLLGLLDFSYESPFFGVDLMQVPKDAGRIAIAHNYSIAYGRSGHIVVLEPNGEVLGYSFEPGSPKMVAEKPDPDILDEAIAQTQEAHRMFYAGQYHWK